MLAQQNVTRLPGHEQDTAPYTLYKTLLYQDPLCGLYEEHVRSLKSRYDLSSYYAACAKAIRDEDYQNTSPTLQASAAYYRAVCVALSKKWDLGLCLLDAYRAGDREGLAHLLHERLPAAHQAMETLRLCAETMWMQNYKPFGLGSAHPALGGGVRPAANGPAPVGKLPVRANRFPARTGRRAHPLFAPGRENPQFLWPQLYRRPAELVNKKRHPVPTVGARTLFSVNSSQMDNMP